MKCKVCGLDGANVRNCVGLMFCSEKCRDIDYKGTKNKNSRFNKRRERRG